MFVHIQGRRSAKNGVVHNYDFIVYSKRFTFGIDVFWSKDIKNLCSYLSKKLKPYSNFKQITYILSLNPTLDVEKSNTIFNKKSTEYIKCMNYDKFLKEEMIKYERLTDPEGFHEWDLSDQSILNKIIEASK